MNRRSVVARTAAAAAAMLAVLALAAPVRAEDPIPPILPTGSPTPSPSPSKKPTPKPTPKPQPPKAKPPAQPPKQPKGPAPDVYRGPIDQAVAYWMARPKTDSHTTTRLLELLQQLQPPGVPLDREAVMRGVGRFPIAGYTWYGDTWAAPRYIPYFHLHEGADLFAAEGTPVVACANGVIAKLMNGSIGGVSIWLRADDETVYYYGHLRTYAPGLAAGKRVHVGEFIATVGNTGDAVGTPPHVHFEEHPAGGTAIDPKPSLDRWLANAERAAEAAIRRTAVLTAQAKVGAARWRSLFGLLAQPAPRAVRYLATALDPALSGATDHALDRLEHEIDWSLHVPPAGLDSHHDEGSILSPAADDAGVLAAPRRAFLRFG